MRKSVFWIHLVCGLAVGAVVLVMSVTGVLLTYQRQMTEWVDREFWTEPRCKGYLAAPSQLMAAAADYAPTADVTRLTLDSRPEAPVALTLQGGRVLYLDPSSAEVRGEGSQSARAFFRAVVGWHRWFNVSGDGRGAARAVTGWSNLLFLGLILTGLYLWFPRRWTRQHLKPILLFNRKARGKARDFNWHHVFGFWTAIPLALVVASAVVISFPWASNLAYRLAGDEPPVRGSIANVQADSPAPLPPFDPAVLDALVVTARNKTEGWRTIAASLPASAHEPVSFRINEGWAGQASLQSTLVLDPSTHQEVSYSDFSDRSPGGRLRVFLRFAHTGEYWGIPGQTVAGLVSLASILLVWSGIALAWRRLMRPLLSRVARRPG